jgi:drug/metabolite transporter (DMT)-like permease
VTREQTTGYIALLISITLFSTVEVSSKLLGTGLPPLLLAAVRFFLSGLVLLIPAAGILRFRVHRLGARDAAMLLGLGILGVTVSIGFYHTALLYMQANVGAIIFSANPVFVVLFAPLLLDERLTLRKVIAVLLGCLGMAVFGLRNAGEMVCTLRGLLLMGGSIITFALYTVLSRKVMPRYGALVITCVAALVGSVFLMLLSLAVEGSPVEPLLHCSWPGIIYLAVVATALAYWAYFFGIIQIGASRGALFFFLKPLLASVFAWMVLGEQVTWQVVTGALLVLAALFFALAPSMRRISGTPDRVQ